MQSFYAQEKGMRSQFGGKCRRTGDSQLSFEHTSGQMEHEQNSPPDNSQVSSAYYNLLIGKACRHHQHEHLNDDKLQSIDKMMLIFVLERFRQCGSQPEVA